MNSPSHQTAPTKAGTSILSDAAMARIQAEVAPVIQAVAERIHYAEGRRTNFTILAGGLIAAGVALLTFALSNAESHLARWTTAAGAVCCVALGAAIILLYSSQTNTYPWTSATKTWKWFYRDALPSNEGFDFGWVDYFRMEKAKSRTKAEYSRQISLFKNSMHRLKSDSENLDQDLEQLYVLHINEKYKNLHLTQLRKLTNWGILVMTGAVVFSGVFGHCMDKSGEHVSHFTAQSGTIAINGTWSSPAVGQNQFAEILLDISAQNSSKASANLPRWSVLGKNGARLPFDVLEAGPATIAGGGKLRYTVLLRSKSRAELKLDKVLPE